MYKFWIALHINAYNNNNNYTYTVHASIKNKRTWNIDYKHPPLPKKKWLSGLSHIQHKFMGHKHIYVEYTKIPHPRSIFLVNLMFSKHLKFIIQKNLDVHSLKLT